MSLDEYRSIFAGFQAGVLRCPEPGCEYAFAPDLEDVAVERHRSAHAAQEWQETLDVMSAVRQKKQAKHDEWLAAQDADIDRLKRWAGLVGTCPTR